MNHCVSIPRNTFMAMVTLAEYYGNEAGRVLTNSEGIGPVYSAPPYVQREHGIGNF